MSSILTNSSAMVALQTLRGINKGLAQTQSEISTGKTIGSARDNAAVWSISKTMESDVKGFKAISDSLSLGTSTVGVARQAAETVTDLLTQMKGLVVASQEDNVDRTKIQTDIVALRGQIESVVGAAQFNGLNLVNGSVETTNANAVNGINVLSSIDRDSSGATTASYIGVDAQNLSSAAGTTLTAAAAAVGTDGGTAGVIDAVANNAITLDTFAFQGGGAALSATDPGADAANAAALIAGDRLSLTIGSVQANITVAEGDTATALVSKMKDTLTGNGLDASALTLDITTAGELTITNVTNEDIAFSFEATRGSGDLSGLAGLDVSSAAGAQAALGAIDTMIGSAIDAAASFGSAQKRVDTQADFVSNLSDALNTGIGSLVDADMEATSARLQALQVQQQLATQSLSIANQQPQNILSLFR